MTTLIVRPLGPPLGNFWQHFEVNPATEWNIWALNLSDRKALPFLQTLFNESVPRFSPDGKRLAARPGDRGEPDRY